MTREKLFIKLWVALSARYVVPSSGWLAETYMHLCGFRTVAVEVVVGCCCRSESSCVDDADDGVDSGSDDDDDDEEENDVCSLSTMLLDCSNVLNMESSDMMDWML